MAKKSKEVGVGPAVGQGANLGDVAAEWAPIGKLVPWAKNPRKNHDVRAIARSIEAHGYGRPIVARREDGMIIIGHGEHKAAISLGHALVPVRWLSISKAQAEKLAIADNKTAEGSEWDHGLLDELVRDFTIGDLIDVGFSDRELGRMIKDLNDTHSADRETEFPPTFAIVVNCRDEEQQQELLTRFTEEELDCRAITN